MEKPKPVKISMRENPKFFADAIARHFTQVVIELHEEKHKKSTEQKPA